MKILLQSFNYIIDKYPEYIDDFYDKGVFGKLTILLTNLIYIDHVTPIFKKVSYHDLTSKSYSLFMDVNRGSKTCLI